MPRACWSLSALTVCGGATAASIVLCGICTTEQIFCLRLLQTIAVCQFNVLASNLATNEHFAYAKPSVLDWSNRKHILLAEFKAMLPSLPDIACFEEMTDYWTFWKSTLGQLGFDSVFVKVSIRSRALPH